MVAPKVALLAIRQAFPQVRWAMSRLASQGSTDMRSRISNGFTLVEALIALAILGLVLGIAFAAISQGLRVQSGQEAATATQARLRRITEVFTQEIRSAVLGAVSNTPYTSGANSISFMLLDGGAGFQVTTIDAASNNLNVVASSEHRPGGHAGLAGGRGRPSGSFQRQFEREWLGRN